MKRLILLCAVAFPLLGLTRLPSRGDKIAVLRMSGDLTTRSERTIASTIEHDLPGELQERGFEAFDAGVTFEDLQSGAAHPADYYIEIVSSGGTQRAMGAGGAAIGPVGLEVGVVVARVAAEMRVYDGRTLALIDHFDLQQKSTAAVPTGIGVGARPFWFMVALPFVQNGQYRSAAHEVARQAADLIARR